MFKFILGFIIGAALRSVKNVPHIHVCDHKEEYL